MLKRIFKRKKKDKHKGEVNMEYSPRNSVEDDIKYEPSMTLTQMVDMLTGKENNLFTVLQENFDLHTILLDEVGRLETEVTKPAKQQDPIRVKHELDSVKYYVEQGV